MLPTVTRSTTLFSVATLKQWLRVTSNVTKTISSLTRVGTIATAVCSNHGYSTNTYVLIAGANEAGYSGNFLITVIDANTFTYTMATTPSASPATGTPTVTVDNAVYAAVADAATEEL